eukprot:s1491_g8.t1
MHVRESWFFLGPQWRKENLQSVGSGDTFGFLSSFSGIQQRLHQNPEKTNATETEEPILSDQPVLPPALSGAGSCIHLRAALCRHDDLSLFEAIEKEIEVASYQRPGDALGFHRSRKHLQIWGDALSGSRAFASVSLGKQPFHSPRFSAAMLQKITQALAMFDLTLVDCWANLYRCEDDFKSWHHDNYQDWSPRPTATIGLSLGQVRALAFQDARTQGPRKPVVLWFGPGKCESPAASIPVAALVGGEYHVLQHNGDIFAFDEPFNNFFKHSVPAAKSPAGFGKRISVILFVNEHEQVPRTLRVRLD